MDKSTTFNISFGCPKCGHLNSSKSYSNEGAVTELFCDACSHVVDLFNEKEEKEEDNSLQILQGWVRNLVKVSIGNTPVPTGDIPHSYIEEVLKNLNASQLEAYGKLKPAVLEYIMDKARELWRTNQAVDKVQDFLENLFRGRLVEKYNFVSSQAEVILILLNSFVLENKIPKHLFHTAADLKRLSEILVKEHELRRAAVSEDDLTETFAEILSRLGFVRE